MDCFGKEQWVEMFSEIGLTEEQMMQWHTVFETRYPATHQDFMEWLGIPAAEIETIRNRCKQ